MPRSPQVGRPAQPLYLPPLPPYRLKRGPEFSPATVLQGTAQSAPDSPRAAETSDRSTQGGHKLSAGELQQWLDVGRDGIGPGKLATAPKYIRPNENQPNHFRVDLSEMQRLLILLDHAEFERHQ